MDPLKKHLQTHPPAGAPGPCLSDEELFRVTHEKPAPGERERAINHAIGCASCTEKLAALKSFADEPPAGKEPPASLKNRAAAAQKRTFSAPIGLWLALFALFMALSFLAPRYFIQMVVIAAVFGGKWLIESRARHLHIRITHGAGGGRDSGSREGRRNAGRLQDAERTADD